MTAAEQGKVGTGLAAECELYGWQKRYDELHADPTKPMPGPWRWEIHDASMATLCGGGEDAIVGHVMAVGPCPACYKDKAEWEWGRCLTPSEANARLIAAAPDLLEALQAITDPNNSAIVYFVPSDAHAQKLLDEARAAIAKATRGGDGA